MPSLPPVPVAFCVPVSEGYADEGEAVKQRTYCRVYHEIVDDPKFRRVYYDDAALGTWLRMLLMADQMYPNSAPMPEETPQVAMLLRCGLIKRRPGNRYIVTGLEREREMRSQYGRNAAAVRWQSGSNASRAEQSKAEQEQGLLRGNGTHDGRHGNTCLVCFPPSEQKVRVVK